MKEYKLLIYLSLTLVMGFYYSVNAQVSDVDGNKYSSIQIGEQVWMGENLHVSHFRNGDPIPHAKSKEAWDKAGVTGSPAWCYYENEPSNGAILGKLYNWYAVNDERGLAPLGWHVPSDDDWTELTDNQGGKEKAGIIMKSMTMWNDYENIREKGVFEGLPGGIRLNGNFKHGGAKGTSTYWWSQTSGYLGLQYYGEYAIRSGWSKPTGISVRCVKDYTGESKEYYENGQLKKIGTISNGIHIGEWKEYHENGQLSLIGNYEHGKQEGEWNIYYDNGEFRFAGSFIEGKQAGKWEYYYENGQLMQIGNFLDAKHTGEWKFYYDHGGLKETGNFLLGDKTGVWKYYHENGQLSSMGNLKLGISINGIEEWKTGAWKYYYENGYLNAIGSYIEGKLTGEWEFYYVNGQLRSIKAYQEDNLMEIFSLLDKTGNKLDKGTLANGNGTVNSYDDKGTLVKTLEYLNGQVKE